MSWLSPGARRLATRHLAPPAVVSRGGPVPAPDISLLDRPVVVLGATPIGLAGLRDF